MLGFVFATVDEATPLVRDHSGNRVDRVQEGDYLHLGDSVATVAGTGKIKATLATERLLHKYDLDVLVHAGGALSLSDDVEPGEVIGATHVLEGDRVDLEDPTYPRMPLEVPFDGVREGTLVTQDHSASDPDELSYWERIADISDNTGYAVAFVAGQHGVPCHIVKGIRRSAPDDGTDGRSEEVYQAVADLLRDHYKSIENPN